jgi:predicted permease
MHKVVDNLLLVLSAGTITAGDIMRLAEPIDLISKLIGIALGSIAIYRFIQELNKPKK